MSPVAHSAGSDGFGLSDELLPCGVDDRVAAIDGVWEPVQAEILPDLLNWVKLGGCEGRKIRVMFWGTSSLSVVCHPAVSSGRTDGRSWRVLENWPRRECLPCRPRRTTPDIKKAIRIISTTRGVERVHIIAHSRGTDVLATAIGQLGIEAYITRSSLSRRYNIANLVLFAPDIDINVASSKMFGPVSDPDLPFGTKANPSGLFPPQGSVHLTVYSSPNDRALGLSGFLFGSVMRLGQLAVEESPTGQRESEGLGDTSQATGLGDFIEFEGNAGFIGHGYFLSNPTVGADLVALIRDRRKVGDPGRPLVEIKRPFWRIVDEQEQVRNSGQQI
jgi:Alpha/beta hydrolase of unknown function (DUF900)